MENENIQKAKEVLDHRRRSNLEEVIVSPESIDTLGKQLGELFNTPDNPPKHLVFNYGLTQYFEKFVIVENPKKNSQTAIKISRKKVEKWDQETYFLSIRLVDRENKIASRAQFTQGSTIPDMDFDQRKLAESDMRLYQQANTLDHDNYTTPADNSFSNDFIQQVLSALDGGTRDLALERKAVSYHTRKSVCQEVVE